MDAETTRWWWIRHAPVDSGGRLYGSEDWPANCEDPELFRLAVAIQLTLVTNGAGAVPLAWGSWPSGLSGLSLWFQYAIADGAAVCGTALSNAVRADVP